jgi:hypothetical protein
MEKASFHMDSVFQGWNLTGIEDTFEGMLREGRIRDMDDNDLLKIHMMDAAQQIETGTSAHPRKKLVKISKQAHVDGMAALLDAMFMRQLKWAELGKRLMNGGAYCTKCKKARDERARREVYAKAERKRKLSYIWGGIVAGVLLLIALGLTTKFGVKSFLIGLPVSAAGFCFLSCLILDNNFIGDVVLEIWSWGFVKMPGIIFTLDIDGCLFFIGVKILFAILGFLLGLLAAVAAIAIGMALAVFVYPFALRRNITNPDYVDY